MQINDLLIFKAVAEHGSFSKAAEATHTVQSNVTARIKMLETEFNATLFARTSRSIQMTDAGAELLKTAKQILLMIEQTKTAINGGEQLVKGVVRIGCIHTTAALRVPGILQHFGETYPDVEFKLKTGTSAALVKQVLSCQLDGAFVAGDITDPRLSSQPILTEQLGIVASSLITSYEKLQQSGRKLKLIVFSDGCSYRRLAERITKDWPVSKISLIEMDTLEGILNAVEKNLGVTLLPVALIERLYQYKSLKVFSLPQHVSQMATVFVKRNDVGMSSAYTKFYGSITDGYKA
ncbi:LysR family transcriptional regulator [Pedobacter frigiditerrae]|uniref:LysR family transcriptional regulator n=1 Tax=Pedobacter frigiditerrae TaxID=2530452 RepID=A0A4V2MIS2_9SPHI|nr:LysR family transcriptional regulator [Pedobacter frigiditerrae]TCC91556.1 LysR family transcriptional regulator [Pedobacter frigiditerrae]